MARAVVRVADFGRRLPEAGRIRFGEKGSRGEPRKLDVFRFTSRDEAAIGEIAALYGGTAEPWSAQPGQWQVKTAAKEIPIVLPPDPLRGTPIYELWAGGGVLRRCDGEVCFMPRQTDTGAELVEQPCVCAANGTLECKPITRLTVLLPEIKFGGGWRIESNGWNAAQELPGMVEMIQVLQERGLTRATLALEARTSKLGGKTRNFMVPVLRPAVSVDAILSGEGTVRALGRAPVPVPGLVSGEGAGDREVRVQAESDGSQTDLGVTPSSDDLIVEAEIIDPALVASRRKMHAMLRDLKMGTTERHALVKRITNGRLQSSNDLDIDELKVLQAALQAIKDGNAFFDGVDPDGFAVVTRR